jgi:molybdate transport system permease protein
MSEGDWFALSLSLKLAISTMIVLLLIAVPLAWWLSQTRSKLKSLYSAFFSLPLVLPPTVLGFYFLVFLSPEGSLGHWLQRMGVGSLVFSFSGLLVGSVIYSLPFVLQPLQNGFESTPTVYFEVAAALGLNPCRRFFLVALPQIKNAFLSAAILGFAHTIGEFGVVLMIGGSIPKQTKVLSIALFDHVEALEYQQANMIALGLLIFSFLLLYLLFSLKKSHE